MKRKLARLLVLMPGLVALFAASKPALADCNGPCQNEGVSPEYVLCGCGYQYWAPCNTGVGIKTYCADSFTAEIVGACNSCSCGDTTCFHNAMINGLVYWDCGSC